MEPIMIYAGKSAGIFPIVAILVLVVLPVFPRIADAGEGGIYDGVTFTDDEAAEALEIANDASRTQIQYPGDIHDPEQTTIIDGRPWASLMELSDAPGIETETMQALLDYVQETGYYEWAGVAYDINNATISELTDISGIGTVTATSIYNRRGDWNYYEQEDHLSAIDGIGITEIDGWMASVPGIYVSSYDEDAYHEQIDEYFGDYPRYPNILTVEQVTDDLDFYENTVIRFEDVVVTYIYNPGTSSTFYIGDWGDESSFYPDTGVELKVYIKDRTDTMILDPYDMWEDSDGEPYSRSNFYRNWDPLSGGYIDENHLFSIEGVLVYDDVYGWELIVRPDWYAGEDRITLLENWLDPEDWEDFYAFYDKLHIGAKIKPTYSNGWTVSISERLVYAHPCISYAESQGETPPGSNPYFDYGEPQSEFVSWFLYWLYEWKNAPELDHPLINEVYIDAYDENNSEFVELFNPTGSDIDISGWDLWDGNGVEAEIISGVIPAYGHFLVADGGWSTGKDDITWPPADIEDEMSLTNSNHGIALRNAADTVIDAFGWGSPGTGEPYEGTPASNPAGSGYGFERYSSQDTDDNSADFFENPPGAVNPERSTDAVLSIDITDIDIGTGSPGDLFSTDFTAANLGTGTLDVSVTEDAEWIVSVDPTDFSLGEGEEQAVTVEGAFPVEAGYFETIIDITSNGGDMSILIHGVVVGGNIYIPADYSTIQAGIDAASDGDFVIVSGGTYTGAGNRDIDFTGKAITVMAETGRSGAAVVDCEGAGRGFLFQGGEDSLSVLEGMTIINGSAEKGGGIYCILSSPVIRNNIVDGNSAERDGGGIYCFNSSATMTGNTISGNTNYSLGAGIYCEGSLPVIHGNTLSGNRAYDYGGGGGIGINDSQVEISDNSIIDNYSSESGGGIWIQGYSQVIVVKNVISGNESSEGGGIYCQAPVEFQNNSITGNSGWRAGGVYLVGANELSFINNTVSENITDSEGGGIYCGTNSSPIITNTIVWGNEAPGGDQIYCSGGIPVVTFCDVGGGWTGEGNIDADPLFVDPETGDFHLTDSSPCIDVGTDTGVYNDIDGDTRPQGPGFDIGSDEAVSISLLEVFLTDYPGSIQLGETLQFTAGARNIGEEDAAFDEAELFVTGPAEVTKRLYSGAPITLSPGDSASTVVSLYVPGNAPLGIYTVEVVIYSGGDEVSSDFFEIEVFARF